VGLLRLFLALAVLNSHLPLMGVDPPLVRIFHSFVAVCAFFMISGFYMSLVLHETYGVRQRGIADFYLNRILRLFPTYWVVMICYFIFRGFSGGFLDWLEQAAIFPHVLWGTVTLNPTNVLVLGQMYTVGLEMLFYALAPLVVRRSMTTLGSFFVIAVVVHFLPMYLGLPVRPWQYEFFPAILVFFLAGALSYRLYLAVGKLQFDRRWGYLSWLVLGLYCVRFGNIGGPFTNALAPLAFYLLVAVAIPFLFLASKDSKVDRFLGDLSYPLYVVHFAVIYTIGQTYRSAMLVTGLSLILSIALVVLVERPIDTLRHKMSVQRWLDIFDSRRNKPVSMR
jgi:peptidoglycan/LPS O-acetylase OafA/YrhL